VYGAIDSSSSSSNSGYIAKGMHIDASKLLPSPPVVDSKAQAADAELSQQYLKLVGTARWDQSAVDAKIRYPNHAGAFSCAAGVPLTESTTPITNNILYRTMIDVAITVRPIKKLYQRQRPYMANQEPICTPTGIRHLQKDGSYPSGHSATGWAWGLILAEIIPDATGSVLARGWEFGQSRAICNVHWESDVEQGRIIGAMVVAQLHGNPEFRSDLEAARDEITAVIADGEPFDFDCASEDAALREGSIDP
jgi:acid phosphatase (class A)